MCVYTHSNALEVIVTISLKQWLETNNPLFGSIPCAI